MDTETRVRWAAAWARRDLRELAPERRQRAYVVGAAILLAVVLFSLLIFQLFAAHHNQFDLKIYYNAINFWTGGGNLYDYAQPDPVNGLLGFTYPPAAALLMSPMGSLSLTTIVVLTFVAIMSASFCWIWLLSRERIELPTPQFVLAVGIVTAVSFWFQPMAQNVSFGQINIFLALLVTVDVLVLGKSNNRWTGVGIGLAMALKVVPGIFLLYLVIAKKWRALLVALGTAAAVTAVAAVIEHRETWQYFTQLLWESNRVGVPDNTSNQSLNGLIARVFAPAPPDRMLWLALSGLVLILVWKRVKSAVKAGDSLAALTLIGLLGVLVSPVSWIHHMVWVVPAGIVLCSFLWTHRAARSMAAAAVPSAEDAAHTKRWRYLFGFTIAGLLVWYLDTRSFFGLRGFAYGDAGPVAILGGSLQTIWMLIAIAVLPVRQAGAAHPVATRRNRVVSSDAE